MPRGEIVSHESNGGKKLKAGNEGRKYALMGGNRRDGGMNPSFSCSNQQEQKGCEERRQGMDNCKTQRCQFVEQE